jgi:hypothetical protein
MDPFIFVASLTQLSRFVFVTSFLKVRLSTEIFAEKMQQKNLY